MCLPSIFGGPSNWGWALATALRAVLFSMNEAKASFIWAGLVCHFIGVDALASSASKAPPAWMAVLKSTIVSVTSFASSASEGAPAPPGVIAAAVFIGGGVPL